MLHLKLFVAIIWTLKTLLTILLATLILLGIIPLILIISCPFHIYRKILFHSARYLKPSFGKMLTTRSALLASEDLYNDPRNTLINATLFEGAVSLHVVRSIIQEKAIDARNPSTGELLFPELQQNITFWMGYPFWKDVKNYKLEEHVHYYEGLRTDNNKQFIQMTAKEVNKLIKKLALKPFREDRALGEIIVIPNYQPDEKSNLDTNLKYSLIICRQHHALADGLSNYKLMQHFSLSKFNFVKAHDYTLKEKFSTKSTFKSALFNLSLLFRMPYDVAKVIIAAPHFRSLWKLVNNKNNLRETSDAGVTGETLSSAVSPLIQFSKIKEIATFHKVSCTTVVLASIAGAIRNVMFSNFKKVPDTLRIGLVLPLPGHPDKLRNFATGALIVLPLAEEDRLKRLQITYERIEALKKSTYPIAFSLLTVLAGATPAWFVPHMKRFIKKRQGVILTNFAGPMDSMEMFGHRVHGFNVFSGMVKDTQYLMLTFVTLGGLGRLTVGADRSVLPSDKIAEQIVDEFFKQLDKFKTAGHLKVEDIV